MRKNRAIKRLYVANQTGSMRDIFRHGHFKLCPARKYHHRPHIATMCAKNSLQHLDVKVILAKWILKLVRFPIKRLGPLPLIFTTEYPALHVLCFNNKDPEL